jgi:hypothetical protein
MDVHLGAHVTPDAYRRRRDEAMDALEVRTVVPSVGHYLDAIRPIWRSWQTEKPEPGETVQ